MSRTPPPPPGLSRRAQEVLAFITEAGSKLVVMAERIIGCLHEEGIDDEGATCPVCLFWAGRGPLDRQAAALAVNSVVLLSDPRRPFGGSRE